MRTVEQEKKKENKSLKYQGTLSLCHDHVLENDLYCLMTRYNTMCVDITSLIFL